MKLQFIAAHHKVGPLRKELGLSDGGTRSYPLAAKVTSYTEEFDANLGVKAYRDLLAKHAMHGRALYRGVFTKDLVNESRRDKTDKSAKTEFLVLDIDGLKVEDGLRQNATATHVKAEAERVIAMLPQALHNVSYVAVASSSFGLKEKSLSVHIHFLLDKPYDFRLIKDWTTSLNYTQQDIYECLGLTASKMRISSVVDPCLAEPARVVYIAPPLFGPRLKNPFNDDSQRFVAVEKDKPLFNLGDELTELDSKMDIVAGRRDSLLRELQQAAGIPARKVKFQRMRINGREQSVAINPPEARMSLAYEDNEFVRYNIGAGSNNAYWVFKSNPEIVHSFIPDEPPFLFKEADAEAYARHVEQFGGGFEKVVDAEAGVTRKIQRSVFIDQTTDSYTTLEVDIENNEIVELNPRQNAKVAEEWLSYYGVVVPDPVPPKYVVMEPQREEVQFRIGDKEYVNRFKPTKYMAAKEEHPYSDTLRYGSGWLLTVECPIISEVILHMLGDDFECFEHFVNWLAFIFQTKDKAGTAWLVHGEEGTGKGLFFHQVLSKLFGTDYAVQNTLQGIADDQFNGWMEDAMVLMVDEFNMKGASVGNRRAAALLRNLITEPMFMVRRMQQMQRRARQRLNFIFGTNDFDAMQTSDKRRYNIAVRQSRMLKMRIPAIAQDWDGFIAALEPELPRFARFLKAFNVNKQMVSTILDNEAKHEMQAAGMSAAERFFDHIKRGDFGAFIGILDKPAAGLEAKELLALNRVKTFVTACLEYVNTGEPCYILKDDLRMVYSYLASKEVSDNAFGRMMPTTELKVKRHERPVGSMKPLHTRPRCIEVYWTYDDKEVLELIRRANAPLPTNVSPFGQPQQADEIAMAEERIKAEAKAALERG
ncbi:primase-helicase family protein [Shewanella gaetbuli]|uniref:DUF5906 domain-containing protein n=1 Tax=Shewanella gaetbuli TaxID=220752 RepID=A0A9X2CKB8_9GAMM|nr:primase-helicase family protein [Shewanella gaetbuli]MCL1142951.1 DUF5906 domain-containing protein [Shewanella gaetbuli]